MLSIDIESKEYKNLVNQLSLTYLENVYDFSNDSVKAFVQAFNNVHKEVEFSLKEIKPSYLEYTDI